MTFIRNAPKKFWNYFTAIGETMRKKSQKNDDHLQYEFLPAVLEITETPPSPIGRFIIWTIVSLVGVLLLWSIIGKVDEVAVARGKVIPDGRLKVLQPLEEGIITAIHVEEGQKVTQGQLLIELDSTIKQADVENLQQTSERAYLEKELLYGELYGKKVDVSKMKDKIKSLPPEVISFHVRLRSEREAEYANKKSTLESAITQRQEELNIAESELITYQKKYELLQMQYKGFKELYEIQSISEMEFKSKQVELEAAKQEFESQKIKIIYAKERILEARKNLDLYNQEYRRALMDMISEKEKGLTSMDSELIKAQKKYEFQQLLSPVTGTVHGLSAYTIGGVVTPAQPIVTIVPEGTKMIVEVTVLNQDIGFVKVGQTAEVKLDTFPFQKYGTIPGKVITISPDAFDDEKLGPVYKMKIQLERLTIEVDGKTMIVTPGMTLSAEIKTGRRRIIEFFLSPLVKYAREGLHVR